MYVYTCVSIYRSIAIYIYIYVYVYVSILKRVFLGSVC